MLSQEELLKIWKEENSLANDIPNDMVNHPKHYQGKYECIDVLEDVTKELTGIEAFCTANAIKYLWRWKKKNGLEDLKKAKWYINYLIEKMEGSK